MNLPFIAIIICLVLYVVISFLPATKDFFDWSYPRMISIILSTFAIPVLLAASFTGHGGEQSVVTRPATVTRMGDSIIIQAPRFQTLVTRDISFLDAEVVIDEITPRNAYGTKMTPYYIARIVGTKEVP